MKFTVVFITLLSVSTAWGKKTDAEESKDKREAATGSYLPPHSASSNSYQGPALSQEEASAISIGAGYSVGGAKPSFNFAGQGSGATYQLQSEGVPVNGHGAVQLAPISLQSSHGGLISNDLSQLMSQLSHGINSGAIAIPSSGGQNAYYQFAGQAGNGQELAVPQFSYGSPQLQQYSLGEQSQAGQVIPSYTLSSKGLGTYGSKGPVLFAPESVANNQPSFNYAVPAGHSFEGAALPLGDSGHSLAGLSFGSSGQSFGGSLKGVSSYASPGKSSFKPSTFLGASVQSDSGNNLAGLSGSYGSPSFAAYQSSAGGHGGASLGSAGHGLGFGSLSGFGGGSSKQIASAYLPSKEGYGSVESIASAFSASGQIAPPGTTYGTPSGAYSSNVHAASAPSPAYYVTSSKHSPTFGSGSSSYRGHGSGHNSFSSGPKYSFGGHSGPRFGSPKDAQGAYSETTYNTIKYSEEFKPRFN